MTNAGGLARQVCAAVRGLAVERGILAEARGPDAGAAGDGAVIAVLQAAAILHAEHVVSAVAPEGGLAEDRGNEHVAGIQRGLLLAGETFAGERGERGGTVGNRGLDKVVDGVAPFEP